MSSTSTPNTISTSVWEINYRGDVQEQAKALQQAVEQSGASVTAPVKVPDDDANLGAGEIILTIIATAAAKAIVDVVAKQLREYLRDRAKTKSKEVNLRVAVRKAKGAPGKQHSIDLRGATADAIDQFIANVKDSIVNAIAA